MSGRGLKRVEGGSMRQKAKLASTHASPSEPSATRQEKASARTPDRMRPARPPTLLPAMYRPTVKPACSGCTSSAR